ncbi:MAG TPA: sugar transferase, partial [Azospirillum sp.]|nr:sugar transferase [Azospirillum sp.]
ELPQLWNVIRGDMSVVGPRPLPDYHLAALDPAVYALRQRVRPGITGLWQVSGRSSRQLDEQQHLDAYYVRNWSFWLDLHILARTVVEVVKGRGAW